MALFDSLPSAFPATEKSSKYDNMKPIEEVDKVLEDNNKEFNKLTEVSTMSERVERATQALKDAAEAYKNANVPAQSEDIRALAITFMIDEGKNGRTPQAYAARPTPVAAPVVTGAVPVAAPAQDSSAVRRTFFKPEINVEYDVLVESFDGEMTTQYGPTDKFSLTVNGEPLIQTTKGKLANAYKTSIGATGRLLSTKNGKFTNYSFKVSGVEKVK